MYFNDREVNNVNSTHLSNRVPEYLFWGGAGCWLLVEISPCSDLIHTSLHVGIPGSTYCWEEFLHQSTPPGDQSRKLYHLFVLTCRCQSAPRENTLTSTTIRGPTVHFGFDSDENVMSIIITKKKYTASSITFQKSLLQG